ncbi:Regulator of hypoxia-inducible factor 1 [Halotydeus destructor]|nr:Regulator of hypoxia-inducible factor 1 [Halotydeus destructor]
MLWSFTWLNDMSAPGGREVADFLTKPCRENWWKTLFMVNNINTAGKDICLPQSWFITLDMQLWVVAYIPLHLLHKKPRAGIWACLFLIIAGGMSSMVLSYLTDTPSAPVERQFDFMNAMLHDPIFISVFTFVHSGLSSYFIGVLVAYCCLTYKMSEFKVKVLSCLCPALAVGILVFPEAWSHLYGLQYDRVLDIFYSGFFRLFFAIILIPQLLHMHYGFGENDPIRKFLSGKFWLIAGRLSYSVFVTHMLVIVIVSFVIYDKVPTDALKLTVFLIICEVTCFVFAYLVYVFVESPFASLLSAFTTPNATRVSKEIKPDMILV